MNLGRSRCRLAANIYTPSCLLILLRIPNIRSYEFIMIFMIRRSQAILWKKVYKSNYSQNEAQYMYTTLCSVIWSYYKRADHTGWHKQLEKCGISMGGSRNFKTGGGGGPGAVEFLDRIKIGTLLWCAGPGSAFDFNSVADRENIPDAIDWRIDYHPFEI